MAKKKSAESRTRYFIRQESRKRGWNTAHLSSNGDFLEEQEISDVFSGMALGLDRPDFLVCLNGEPTMVIEAKSNPNMMDDAIKDAEDYSNQINKTKKYSVRFAVGVAGNDENGFEVLVRYLQGKRWVPLKSNGYEITTIPSKKEIELALKANDGTTLVSVPTVSDFIDSAIELSSLLRNAKIEAPLRPKVVGSIVLAMYQGKIDTRSDKSLRSINRLVKDAITQTDKLDNKKKKLLAEALRLTGSDFDRLEPKISRIVSLLHRLNVRSVLQTDTDFLGLFYEAFLRYGYDNASLGIAFTPRHITRLCIDLTGCLPTDRIIDVASGTGGFLVSAFERMMESAKGNKSIDKIKDSVYGFDTNPTIWALSTLNMFFRGDGKSHMENSDCFAIKSQKSVEGKFTRAFLNPPFSQENEPERKFIDVSLEALEPEGLLAVVVKAGIFADDENKNWRKNLVKKHSVLSVISLPEDLFYPTSAPTSILICKAHVPQSENDKILVARIWNDGFVKLKGRRIESDGSQLPEIQRIFHMFLKQKPIKSKIATTIDAKKILDGLELSPQQWLPQTPISKGKLKDMQQSVILSLYQTVSVMPDLADKVIEDLEDPTLCELEINKNSPVSYFFHVSNGKSIGEKNYPQGDYPYISSGDSLNSIIRLVSKNNDEMFEGGITVTAFGQAYVQPWRFMARGNGGSSVRILVPKFKMGINELVWFATQINAQKWRFFYARMAIKTRLERLVVQSPCRTFVSNKP